MIFERKRDTFEFICCESSQSWCPNVCNFDPYPRSRSFVPLILIVQPIQVSKLEFDAVPSIFLGYSWIFQRYGYSIPFHRPFHPLLLSRSQCRAGVPASRWGDGWDAGRLWDLCVLVRYNLDGTIDLRPITCWWFGKFLYIFLHFHIDWGWWSNQTNVFGMGWNHQPDQLNLLSSIFKEFRLGTAWTPLENNPSGECPRCWCRRSQKRKTRHWSFSAWIHQYKYMIDTWNSGSVSWKARSLGTSPSYAWHRPCTSWALLIQISGKVYCATEKSYFSKCVNCFWWFLSYIL